MSFRGHKYHLVPSSPWPLFVSFSTLFFLMSLILAMNNMVSFFTFILSFIFLMITIWLWFRDVFKESVMGFHTTKVKRLMRTSFLLFLASEVMVFAGCFWAFFHSALAPSIVGGNLFPPEGLAQSIVTDNLFEYSIIIYGGYLLDEDSGILKYVYPILFAIENPDNYPHIHLLATDIYNYEDYFFGGWSAEEMAISAMFSRTSIYKSCREYEAAQFYLIISEKGCLINPWGLPCVNTCLLVTSSFTVTYAHVCLRARSYIRAQLGLALTIFLAVLFLFCQVFEYTSAPYAIFDHNYSGTFYILTGLHGFHVIVGTIFLIVCLYLAAKEELMTRANHGVFEYAIWYWHFVDVVWLFLYYFIYIWANNAYFSDESDMLVTEVRDIDSIENVRIARYVHINATKLDPDVYNLLDYNNPQEMTYNNAIKLQLLVHEIYYILYEELADVLTTSGIPAEDFVVEDFENLTPEQEEIVRQQINEICAANANDDIEE